MGTGKLVRYPLGHPTPHQPCLRRLDRMTARHWAAWHGHLLSVHALINAGASLDIHDNEGYGWWDSRLGRPVGAAVDAVGVGQ